MNNKPKFNPNEIGIPNGNFFGMPYSIEESNIVLIPVPWDVTTSLHDGTSNGPNAMLSASVLIDLFDYSTPASSEIKIATHPYPKDIEALNAKLRPYAKEVIEKLASGTDISNENIVNKLKVINEGSDELNDWLALITKDYIDKGKIVGIVGGDHSVPFGFISALADSYEDFGVLHIDAHADLRQGYEGFAYSHASIMYNVSRLLPISKFVQIGLRDVCEEEVLYAESDNRFHVYSDNELSYRKFKGINWDFVCDEVIKVLPDKIYVSFDIDGLEPSMCPNTGTPVPGGLQYNEAMYLLQRIKCSGKKIIGFDLCEVAPGKDNWDAIVGAKVLFQLSLLAQGI